MKKALIISALAIVVLAAVVFFSTNSSTATPPTKTVSISVSGVHCGSCTEAIKTELTRLDGVTEASFKNVNYKEHTAVATVTYTDEKIKEDDLKATIKNIGYGVLTDKEECAPDSGGCCSKSGKKT